MTAPRQVLRNTTSLVTHRCVHRQFLLKPSRVVNEVFRYLLAVAAKRYGVEVHAYCVLSNHYHLVVTDRLAQLPRFAQMLHSLVARALNASRGRDDTFWTQRAYHPVTLATQSAVVDEAAYTLANPVAAGLVRSARQWPGLWSAPERIGAGEVIVHRPETFFDSDGDMPESIGLELTTPPGFASAEAFRSQLEAALAAHEATAVRRWADHGFLGVRRVLAHRPTDVPKSKEVWGQLRPRVAARDPSRRVEALCRLRDFVAAYRTALRAWRKGMREVLFPEGTYLMRVAHGAACAGAG